ncbi:hypothetical protein NY78_0059 [Desulfovibrio sp. TomC]|nr:hypothetical protein NY78_0059 [Desulfovibrio sp. TomC]
MHQDSYGAAQPSRYNACLSAMRRSECKGLPNGFVAVDSG